MYEHNEKAYYNEIFEILTSTAISICIQKQLITMQNHTLFLFILSWYMYIYFYNARKISISDILEPKYNVTEFFF
jgi:hypothetical protein